MVVVFPEPLTPTTITTAGGSATRGKGLSADFSYKRDPVGKQLKEANRRGARKAVIVRADRVAVKDLATGEQSERPLEEFLASPC